MQKSDLFSLFCFNCFQNDAYIFVFAVCLSICNKVIIYQKKKEEHRQNDAPP